ncbi:hypothetical protein HU200_027945 [Digitaria exilis]|uniref:Rx N-terminal domain-containing protein n=1 Tax=Digitaria exilis TaxID=1010633 RepID=A0A835C4A6_9POAL|nr:hypothetical protein HU200_027945 [Digitaria exilis]
MADVVSSAVVQETVSQVLSGLVQLYDGKEKLNANKHLERLEMAHVKLEAALGISNTWIITDASLLRWRKKLKRAAQECDDTLHKFKERIREKELMEQEMRNSTFPKRIAHATKSLIFSAFTHNDNELSRSLVQRLEWFADGASEFLRFIELGGTPRPGFLFTPHGSSKDMLPADRSATISAIFGKDQHCIHTDITLEQLNETMLPKAMDYFCQNTEATVYRMLWNAKHGTEYIDFEKGIMEMPRTQRTSGGA